MKFDQLKEKVKTITSRIGKKTIIVTASVIVIGIAMMLNFILISSDNSKEGLKPAIDMSDISEKDESKNASEEYEDTFATMVLSRQQAREEAIEVLQGVVDSKDAVDDMKTGAMEDIKRIASEIEIEANIESLIKSKGFEQCVAVVNGDTASVIVKSDGILPNEISQISEIVYEQAGIHPTNLNIIEKN